MSQSLARKERRKHKRDTNKVLSKLTDIVDKVHKENGYQKMFICINTRNQRDIMVLNYTGNESLEKSLGADVEIEVGELNRHNQLVILAEVKVDGGILIDDGQSVYEMYTPR